MTDRAYKSFRQDELEYQYNPRVSVPEFPQLAKVRSAQARKVRESAKSWLNIPYGSSAREALDIYAADRAGGPVLVYIHGGYWRSGTKEDNANFIPAFTERGATVVLVEYDLCPKVTVSDIVRQTRAAIAYTFRNVIRCGGDPSRFYISGHSAGGHLTAMALANDWEKEGLPKNFIKGAVAMSGVHDLDMVMHISANEEIRMTPEIAKQNSPFLKPPAVNCRLLVAVGGEEPEGWKQMSKDYFEFCKHRDIKAEYLEVPGANHYTMSEHLGNPASPVAQAIFKLMEI
ncbi:MAG TPA: alpha/beta hydrolase [Candidatus Binatia bacterium]|nr:alpha/beta hydrolase [Candidatus Binatia bacterium]